jgi:hypothetical protein
MRPSSWGVALIAPIALVISVELAMAELRRFMRRRAPVAGTGTASFNGNGQLAGGGADLGILPIVAAIYRSRELDGGEQLSGAGLSRALAEQGVSISERDARRLLVVLRPPREQPGPEGGAGIEGQDQAVAIVPAGQAVTS